jgi:hypothetical protein
MWYPFKSSPIFAQEIVYYVKPFPERCICQVLFCLIFARAVGQHCWLGEEWFDPVPHGYIHRVDTKTGCTAFGDTILAPGHRAAVVEVGVDLAFVLAPGNVSRHTDSTFAAT